MMVIRQLKLKDYPAVRTAIMRQCRFSEQKVTFTYDIFVENACYRMDLLWEKHRKLVIV